MTAKGDVRVTKEMLAKLLELPKGIVITDAKFDSNRDIVSLIVRSAEPIVPITWSVDEAQSVEGFDGDFEVETFSFSK